MKGYVVTKECNLCHSVIANLFKAKLPEILCHYLLAIFMPFFILGWKLESFVIRGSFVYSNGQPGVLINLGLLSHEFRQWSGGCHGKKNSLYSG